MGHIADAAILRLAEPGAIMGLRLGHGHLPGPRGCHRARDPVSDVVEARVVDGLPHILDGPLRVGRRDDFVLPRK